MKLKHTPKKRKPKPSPTVDLNNVDRVLEHRVEKFIIDSPLDLESDQLLQNIISTIEQIAEKKQEDDGSFLNELLQIAQEMIKEFNPDQLTEIIFKLATIKHNPGKEFLQTWILAALPQVNNFNPNNIASSIFGLSIFKMHHITFLNKSLEKLTPNILELDKDGLTCMIYGLGLLRHNPGQEFFNNCLQNPNLNVNGFDMQDLSYLISGFAKLRYKFQNSDFLQSVLKTSTEQLNDISEDISAFCNMVYCSASLLIMQDLQGKTLVCAKELISKFSQITNQEVNNFDGVDALYLISGFGYLKKISSDTNLDRNTLTIIIPKLRAIIINQPDIVGTDALFNIVYFVNIFKLEDQSLSNLLIKRLKVIGIDNLSLDNLSRLIVFLRKYPKQYSDFFSQDLSKLKGKIADYDSASLSKIMIDIARFDSTQKIDSIMILLDKQWRQKLQQAERDQKAQLANLDSQNEHYSNNDQTTFDYKSINECLTLINIASLAAKPEDNLIPTIITERNNHQNFNHEEFLNALLEKAQQGLGSFDANQLLNLINIFKDLQYNPGEAFLNNWEQAVNGGNHINSFNNNDIINLITYLTALRNQNQEFLNSLLEAMNVEENDQLTYAIFSIVNIEKSVGHVLLNEWIDQFGSKLSDSENEISANELACSIWIFGILNLNNVSFLNDLLDNLQSRISELNEVFLPCAIYGLAKTKDNQKNALNFCSQDHLRHLEKLTIAADVLFIKASKTYFKFNLHDIPSILWSMYELGYTNNNFANNLFNEVKPRINELNLDGLTHILSALSSLKIDPGTNFLNDWVQRASKIINKFKLHEICYSLWALGALVKLFQISVTDKCKYFVDNLLEKIEPNIETIETGQLLFIMDGLKSLQHNSEKDSTARAMQKLQEKFSIIFPSSNQKNIKLGSKKASKPKKTKPISKTPEELKILDENARAAEERLLREELETEKIKSQAKAKIKPKKSKEHKGGKLAKEAEIAEKKAKKEEEAEKIAQEKKKVQAEKKAKEEERKAEEENRAKAKAEEKKAKEEEEAKKRAQIKSEAKAKKKAEKKQKKAKGEAEEEKTEQEKTATKPKEEKEAEKPVEKDPIKIDQDQMRVEIIHDNSPPPPPPPPTKIVEVLVPFPVLVPCLLQVQYFNSQPVCSQGNQIPLTYDTNYNTEFHKLAMDFDSLPAFKELFNYNPNLWLDASNFRNVDGDTVFHIFLQNIEKIIPSNNNQDFNLKSAVLFRWIEWFLKSGTSPTIQNNNLDTPLHIALKLMRLPFTENQFQEYNQKHSTELTVCFISKREKLHAKIIALLLNYYDESTVNIQNNQGDTPLHLAISFMKLPSKEESKQPFFQSQAKFFASRQAYYMEVFTLFEKFKASYMIKNTLGETPLDTACHRHGIARILNEAFGVSTSTNSGLTIESNSVLKFLDDDLFAQNHLASSTMFENLMRIFDKILPFTIKFVTYKSPDSSRVSPAFNNEPIAKEESIIKITGRIYEETTKDTHKTSFEDITQSINHILILNNNIRFDNLIADLYQFYQFPNSNNYQQVINDLNHMIFDHYNNYYYMLQNSLFSWLFYTICSSYSQECAFLLSISPNLNDIYKYFTITYVALTTSYNAYNLGVKLIEISQYGLISQEIISKQEYYNLYGKLAKIVPKSLYDFDILQKNKQEEIKNIIIDHIDHLNFDQFCNEKLSVVSMNSVKKEIIYECVTSEEASLYIYFMGGVVNIIEFHTEN